MGRRRRDDGDLTMLAARLHGNRDLRVEQMAEPDAVGPAQVRVEPQWCGICGTDLHEFAHGPLYTPKENLPQVIGHEFSAIVTELGDGVTNVRPGDRVAVLPHVFCGTCYYCVRGRQGLCETLRLTGVTWPWGGLAEQAVVPASQVVRLPDEVSFEQGAILEPLASVGHAVERSRLAPGDSVLITGGGPIGQLAVLVTAAAGAGRIFVSEPQPARRAMAERAGVTAAFDPAATDVAREVLERTDGLGADCAVECSGSQPGLDTCIESVRRAGTVAVIAIHLGDRTVQPEGWVWRDLTVAGVWSFKIWDTPRILAQVAAGTLPVERIVTSRIDVHDVVSSGIERLADPGGDQVKILVHPKGAP
jgi:(R,R)-butanediol dehydrogenase/meso-butanediol dehydrogenase/diacetyl reductase